MDCLRVLDLDRELFHHSSGPLLMDLEMHQLLLGLTGYALVCLRSRPIL